MTVKLLCVNDSIIIILYCRTSYWHITYRVVHTFTKWTINLLNNSFAFLYLIIILLLCVRAICDIASVQPAPGNVLKTDGEIKRRIWSVLDWTIKKKKQNLNRTIILHTWILEPHVKRREYITIFKKKITILNSNLTSFPNSIRCISFLFFYYIIRTFLYLS